MPKFKQFTNVKIRVKSSLTLGNCLNDDGIAIGCSKGTAYQTQSACTAAGGTWTTYTKASCHALNNSLLPTSDQLYNWVGNRYNDFTIQEVIHIDLEKVLRYEAKFDKLTGSVMSGYTHVVTDQGDYTIEKSLEDFMGIMAIEVPE